MPPLLSNDALLYLAVTYTQETKGEDHAGIDALAAASSVLGKCAKGYGTASTALKTILCEREAMHLKGTTVTLSTQPLRGLDGALHAKSGSYHGIVWRVEA